MKNGDSYDIEGEILALKRAVNEEKKEKAKTGPFSYQRVAGLHI